MRKSWLGWSIGGAIAGFTALLALLMTQRLGRAMGMTVGVFGGSCALFIAGSASAGSGVLERTRSILSGVAWALGFIAAAAPFASWPRIVSSLDKPTTHVTHTINSSGATVTRSDTVGSSFAPLVATIAPPVCLAILGLMGLFCERRFLRMAFGDRPKLPWLAPWLSAIAFAAIGSVTIVVVPLGTAFLAHLTGIHANETSLIVIAPLTGAIAASGIGAAISGLRSAAT